MTEHLDGMASVFVVATNRVVVTSLTAVRVMRMTSDGGAHRWTVLVSRM
jgi:hypothetical protein